MNELYRIKAYDDGKQKEIGTFTYIVAPTVKVSIVQTLNIQDQLDEILIPQLFKPYLKFLDTNQIISKTGLVQQKNYSKLLKLMKQFGYKINSISDDGTTRLIRFPKEY